MENRNMIGIIGLGYVGLPLARLFATKYSVIGYDISEKRIEELRTGIDSTLEVDNAKLKAVLVNEIPESNGMYVTNSEEDLRFCSIYIITVPTPIDRHKKPVMLPLINASQTVGQVLKKNDIVIYESTVYPGATEEECVPVLEKFSGLRFNTEFSVGYSPERINPGDKEHTVEKILKVVSGSNDKAATQINDLYASVINAGTHLAPSIKVAEASKVIENSQRDINIAFINELSKIFNLLEISTKDVLAAASTKWNFLPFSPGLVGGHCIGVDPYYLAQKAQEVGYNPEIILSGRRINDTMGEYVGNQVIKSMIRKDIGIKRSKILVLGITFKENCPDVRNTKVIDVVNALKAFGPEVCIHDPWADNEVVMKEYGVELLSDLPDEKFDAIVLAVGHSEFINIDFHRIKKNNSILYDVKNILGQTNIVDGAL